VAKTKVSGFLTSAWAAQTNMTSKMMRRWEKHFFFITPPYGLVGPFVILYDGQGVTMGFKFRSGCCLLMMAISAMDVTGSGNGAQPVCLNN
jgi:hypothetical protein